jgi:predicted esterase
MVDTYAKLKARKPLCEQCKIRDYCEYYKKTSKIIALKEGFEINHTTEECKLLVVLLHGYGSSGDDLISRVPYIKEDLPYACWFAPNGIEKMQDFGYAWFSYVPNNLEKMQQCIVNARNSIFDLIDKKLIL